ncbi:MAG TPA: PAS domain S-box protein, partial [Rhodospirillales bacterium]|nr:PAS domain S-box protein [Rhodospirillales bacterium]
MTIKARITLLIFLLAGGMALSIVKGQDALLRKHLFTVQREWIGTLAQATAEGVSQDTIEGDRIHARELLSRIVSKDKALEYIYVTDFDGLLFAHTFGGGFPKVLAERLYSGDHSGSVQYSSDHGEVEEIVTPLIKGMKAQLYIGVNQKEIEGLVVRTQTDLILIVGLVTLAGMGLSLLIGGRMSRPLQSLCGQISRYAKQGKNIKVEVQTSEPDIKKLADVFNKMVVARSQALSRLRESEGRFKDFSESASDWFWEMDENLRFSYFSDRFTSISGVAEKDLLGKSRRESGLDMEDEQVVRNIETLEAHRSFKNFEHSRLRSDGKVVHMSTSGRPIFDESGVFKGYRGTGTDITGRKTMENHLRRAQRMEAIGQLTGGVAHDFNNLLGVLMGNAEILKDIIGKNEGARRNVEAIIRAVDRGASLTQRLLAFSRQQPLSTVSADIACLIGGLLDMLQRTLGETIELKIEHAPDLWRAMIDPHQFENALVNLAVNARDAMAQGGVLTIETANATLDEAYAKQHEEVTPGDYVRVAVSDTGEGMPPDVLAKVFEPFFTTKDVGKGSGLGLSMVYGFVKQSKGHITIYSEAGRGATVKLYMRR